MAVVRNLIIRSGADFSQLRRQMAAAQKNVQDFKNSINKSLAGIGTALATIGIGAVVADSVRSAMAVEAAVQQINRTMGESANAFVDWANESGRAFNMSKADALKYGAIYSNLLSTFSADTDDTKAKTIDLLKASAVVASGTGRTMEDVMWRIRSGLLGNTEAIEDLGINVYVNMLKSTEAFRKFAGDKSWDQLDFQTQQLIRYYGIMEQANKKFGAEVNKNTNSTLQQFTSVLGDIKLRLGQAFLPILNIILPILTAFATKLLQVMSIVAQVSRLLFGKKEAKQTAKATEEQVGAVDGLGDAYKAAGDAAKKAKGSVAGFDEVNELAEPTKAGAGAEDDAGLSGLDGGLGDMPTMGTATDLDAITTKAEELAAALKSLGGNINLNPMVTAFQNLREAVAPLTKTFFSGLQWLWTNILVPFATWSIEALIPSFLNALAGALTVLNPILTAFKEIGIWLWTNFLQPIASWTGGVIVGVLNSLGINLTKIGTWMKDNQATITTITAVVAGFFAAWKVIELLAFIQTSGGLAAAFGKVTAAIWAATGAKVVNAAKTVILSALYAKDLVVAIAKSVASLGRQAAAWLIVTANMAANRLAVLALDAAIVKNLLVAWVKSAAAMVVQGAKWVALTASMVANKAVVLAGAIAQGVMTAAMAAWSVACGIGTAVTSAFNVALGILTSPITLVIAAIAALVAGVILLIKNWDTVKEVAATVWESIKKVWSVAWTWFEQNVVDPIWGAFKGLFNSIIDGMNFVIRGLNKIKIDIPEWVPKYGGQTFGISLPEIPRLAKGGITNGEMTAVIGDNPGGREVVSPLDDLMSMIQSAVATTLITSQELNGGQQQRQPDIVLNIDGQQFARITNPYNSRETTRIGGSMIKAT